MSTPINSQLLQKVPLLRILIPFCVGILLFEWCSSFILPIVLISIGTIVYIVLNVLLTEPMQRLKARPYYTIPIALYAAAVGWFAMNLDQPRTIDTKKIKSTTVSAQISDISLSDFSMTIKASLLGAYNNEHSVENLHGTKVILTTRGCNYALRPGDIVTFTANIGELRNMGNPFEIDYALHMRSQGYIYTQHLPAKHVHKIGSKQNFATRATILRTRLQNQILSSRLSPSCQSLIIALLLGNNDLIDKDTRSEFSNAGVAHVLALSGLHVGAIILILWWFLLPLDYMRLRWLRLTITIVALIGFDFFTGLSPSLLRATIMTGVVFLAMVTHRKPTSLNSICVAALIILLFSPYSIYNAGFQLSFITVSAIVIFYTPLNIVSPRKKYKYFFWSTISTSLVASLATLAITAHYFHTLSFLSVVSNLLILPFFPVMIFLAVTFVFFLMTGFEFSILDNAIELCYRYIEIVIKTINNIPFSHINAVYATTFTTIAYSFLVLFVAVWLYTRVHRWLQLAAISLLVIVVHSIYFELRLKQEGMIVFNSTISTPIVYYNHNKAILYTPDYSATNPEEFKRQHMGFFAYYHIDSIYMMSSKPIKLANAIFDPPMVTMDSTRFITIGPGRWKHMRRTSNDKFQALLITKQFHSNMSTLKKLYDFDKVIISGDVYESQCDSIKNQCRRLNIPFINIKENGAYTIK